MAVFSVENKTLRRVLKSLESGSRPKGGVSGISEGVPSIGAEHLNADGGFCFDRIKYIPKEYASRLRRGRIQPGDVLIVKDGATTGKVSYVDQQYPFAESYVNEHVFICRPSQEVRGKYLFYFLRSNSGNSQIMVTFHGAAQGGISSAFVDEVYVPMLTLEDQSEIVDYLDDTIHHVRLIRSRLEKIPTILKKFRQSVLSAACSGSLIESFNSYNCDKWAEVRRLLNDAKDQIDGFPDHWMLTNLGNLCDGFQYGTSKKSETSGLVPVLRMGNLQNGEVDWSDLKYSSDESDIKKYALSDGDVLFNRTNSPDLVGKTSIYRGQSKAIFAGYLIKIKNRHDILHSEYLNYCLNSNYGRQWCKEVRTDGVGQSNINASVLASFLIPLPPIEEQIEITIRVQQLLKIADSLESKYQKAMARIDKIEQSILAKAFSGKHV
jgi:type I restriction enzyme S subunit